jgi:hypothetical protein
MCNYYIEKKARAAPDLFRNLLHIARVGLQHQVAHFAKLIAEVPDNLPRMQITLKVTVPVLTAIP